MDERKLSKILSHISEKEFELHEEHLPFLFRALHSLAPSWHGLCMQLEVQGLDKIYRDGTDVDDCLVLGLQGWLKGENTSWEQLITAIFQPAGGGNQLLAQHVATSVKDIFTFKPIKIAYGTSTENICDAGGVASAVGGIQALLGSKVAARWYQMGVALGTPVGDLEIIRVRKLPPTESEALMLKAWLMNGNMKTWQWLVDSVGHVAGGNHLKLAKELAKKKPSGGETAAASSSSGYASTTAPTSAAITTSGRTGKLDINQDVRRARELLKHLEKNEIRELFMELGLFDSTLQNKYTFSISAYCNDLLRAWMLGRDGVLKSEVYGGGATWENLKEALVALDHHGVAERI